MEKQKYEKNKKTRSPFLLGLTAVFGTFVILCVPTFCIWSYTLLDLGTRNNGSCCPLSQAIIFLLPLIGIGTAIVSSYLSISIMKIHRQSAVTSLAVITTLGVMIVSYLLAMLLT